MAEALIPLLLAIRSVRLVGLLLGIVFHALLALHPQPGIYSFSATVMAIFTLFLPAAFAARFQPPDQLRRLLRVLSAGGLAFLVFWSVSGRLPVGLYLAERWPRWAFKLGYGAALVLAGASFVLVLRVGWRHAQELKGLAPGSLRQLPGLIVVPALLVVVGLQPYLGLRTLACFSMFSNLQTENGQSNHLLMPDGLQLTRWQHDLVEILESNDSSLAHLKRGGLKIPFLELRRIRTVAEAGLRVRFRRSGREFRFVGGDLSTYDSIEPLGFVGRHYFLFRAVESNPRDVRCRW